MAARPAAAGREFVVDMHLLVTAGGDRSALMGLRFVGGFFDDKERVRVTVFYTAPRPPALWEGEVNYASLAEYERRMRKNAEKGRCIVDGALECLVEAGFGRDNLEAKTVVRSVSTAQDILREGDEGLYDALVLGRRGATRLMELMEESVSERVAFSDAACPLWVCRCPEAGRSGVLLCLDGSDASLRTADHVGYVVGGEPRHHVTLLRVLRNGRMGDESPGSMFLRARAILLENGVDPDRIHEKVVRGSSVPKAVLAEAGEGGYAAVAVGRTGRGRSLLRRLFMGSVGRAMLEELKGAVLWMRS